MLGDSGVTVVTNARAFYTTRAAAGALSARHSLRPLYERAERAGQPSRKPCGGIADSCPAGVGRCKSRSHTNGEVPRAQLFIEGKVGPIEKIALHNRRSVMALTGI
jgi:hypothetical protein